MIGWLAGAAGAATLTVTDAGNAGTGTLREALANAAPGDTIAFGTGAFPTSTVTTIVLYTGLSVVDAGLQLQADDRVLLSCHGGMTSGSGLTVSAAGVEVSGLSVTGCPDHGILVESEYVEVHGGTVASNDHYGVVVEGAAASVNHVLVDGVTATANCQSPGVLSCAGFGVRRNGSGLGPVLVELSNDVATNQANDGHGFALVGGESATVSDAVATGNDGHGLLCSAIVTQSVAEAVVTGSVFHSNTGSGVVLGARCTGASVAGSLVGTTGTAALGNGANGIEVFGSDDHHLTANVVADNGGAGISIGGLVSSSPPEGLFVEDNVVGLSADQGTALGNGAEGITISGASGVAVLHSLVGNVVAANAADGIRIAAQEVTLTDNVVGTNRLEDPGLGNAGDGVDITTDGAETALDGQPGATWRANVVSYNDGVGVRVSAADVRVAWNRIGRNDGHGVSLLGADDASVTDNRLVDNGDAGLSVGSGSDRVSLERNEVRDNGDQGFLIDASNSRVRWSGNTIRDNGTCGLYTVDGLNGSSGTARPVVVSVAPGKVTGTYTVPSGRTLEAIELFVADETELGALLGTATFGGGTFTWRGEDLGRHVAPGERVTAVALFDAQYTSRPLGWCGDGCGGTDCTDGVSCTSDTCSSGTCSHATTGNGSACDDGNDCTSGETCSGGGCGGATSSAANGTPCVDGDACTSEAECDGGDCEPVEPSDTTHGCKPEWDHDDCNADRQSCDPYLACLPEPEWRDEGYDCQAGPCTEGDVCSFDGRCVAGSEEPCPEARPGLACTCDPDEGCACEPVLGDDCCTPLELAVDGSGDLLSADCDDGGGISWDEDGDGLPDVWEAAGGVDANCDGDVLDAGEDIDFTTGRDLFWELDVFEPLGGHDHELSTDTVDELVVSYLRGDVSAAFDVTEELPVHTDILTFKGPPNVGAPTWTSHATLERDHFTWARWGVYHYGVNGHRLTETWKTNPGVGDDPGLILGFVSGQDDESQAGIVFHEGGHTLTLGHGPGSNGNLNHLSTMNYRFRRLWDVREGEWVFDYSHDNLNDLDEANLSEVDTFFPGSGDPDGDGWPTGSDCAPNNANRYPCAPETESDTVDSDCDGRDGVREDAGKCQAPAAWDPDKPLYLAFWDCPVSGDAAWQYWAPPHADVTTTSSTARGSDLNCNGVTGEVGVFAQPLLDGDPETSWHFGQDDWSIVWNVGLPFQRLGSFTGVRQYGADDEGDEGPPDTPRPDQPTASIYDTCSVKRIPTASGYRVPVVLFGSADYDPWAHERVRLNGAEPVRDEPIDWPPITHDGYPDRFLLYRSQDLTGLASAATRASIWAEGPLTKPGVPEDGAEPPFAFAHFEIDRPTSPTDTDGDGIQDTCDACPTTGTFATIDPDGCP